MFSIDGVDFTKAVVTGLKRNFTVLDGENAGRVLTGEMVRDVIGSYYNYSIEIDTSFLTPTEYSTLYEIVSAPVDSHTIVVPYNQTTYQYRAYITQGSDQLDLIKNDTNVWSNLSFNFIAMEPKRRPA